MNWRSAAVSTKVRLPDFLVLSLPAAMAAYNDVLPIETMRHASAIETAKGVISVICHLSRSPGNARSLNGNVDTCGQVNTRRD